MEIALNGSSHTVASGATAADLVESLQLGERRVAMEINREIVPRSRYGEQLLNEGDQVEIVHAIGGG